MALRRERQRRRASITSLIDVIFLLLLFFMLASTFSSRAEIDLVTAPSGASHAEPPTVLRLHLSSESMRLNDHIVDDAALVDAIQSAVHTPGDVLAVDVDDATTSQRLIDVLMALRAVPSARVTIVEPS